RAPPPPAGPNPTGPDHGPGCARSPPSPEEGASAQTCWANQSSHAGVPPIVCIGCIIALWAANTKQAVQLDQEEPLLMLALQLVERGWPRWRIAQELRRTDPRA